MALLGQASGAFTESSSSLRLLHVGIRNTVGVVTDASAFAQTNPPLFSASSGGVAGDLISDQVATTIFGVLSGSIAFTRPDIDENVIGGPDSAGGSGCRPLGVFLNHAAGYSFENTPAAASNKAPYVSAQGCYANSLFEQNIQTDKSAGGNTVAVGSVALSAYAAGQGLYASANGYLTNDPLDSYEHAISGLVKAENSGATDYDVTCIGIVKMAPDNTQDEIVYDQRI